MNGEEIKGNDKVIGLQKINRTRWDIRIHFEGV